MRAVRVLSILAGLALAGCSKSPTKPAPSDPYTPMYGTWTGLLMASSDGFGWSATDSVRLIISPTSGTPAMELWQLKVQSTVGYPPAPNAIWHEIPMILTEVSGGTVEIRYWDGYFEASCDPDTATDAEHGALGWNRPSGKWWAGFKPDEPRSGPVSGILATIFWSGISDSLGSLYLDRR